MNANMSSIILIVLMIAFMYFFMIRPQQRQRKEHQAMVNQLKPGDAVVTIGRLHGLVHEVNTAEQTVTIDCEGIYLTFDLSAVAKVNRATPAPATATTVTEAPVESASANKEAAAQAEEEQAPASAATDADDEKPAEQAEK